MSKAKRLNSKQRRCAAKYLANENAKYHETFVLIAPEDYPENFHNFRLPERVWRNRKFIVQEFAENHGIIRLSINRTSIDNSGGWLDGISWDELQEIKNRIGYSENEAVEVFPAQSDVINVANIRHLWVLPEKTGFSWKNKK